MSKKTRLYIGASIGTSFVAKLISRFQYGFKYTHVFYINDDHIESSDPLIIEANETPILSGGIVREGKLFSNDFKYHKVNTKFDVFYIKCTEDEKNKVEQFLRDKIKFKAKYDYLGIIGFIFKSRKVQSKSRFTCGEFIYDALDSAGINLFNFTEPQEVSPRILLKSRKIIKYVK